MTSFIMIMRAQFYWWPLHPIGLMYCSGGNPDEEWLAFLIGWLFKVLISKYSSGRMLRQARNFFIGLILAEGALHGVTSVLGLVSKGWIPRF
jgi:hypothetical protein